MGNYQDRQAELQLYMQHEDGVYGRGTLYSSTKLPSCYLIKNVRLLVDEQQFKLFSQIEDFQNVHLVGLYGYSFGKSCECDSSGILSRVVVSYWEFLSFSLRDCIAYRKRIGVMFHEHEVWHIIKACVNGYLSFERLNVYYQFIEDYILMNQEGRVRLSWNHIEPKNHHLRYYKLQREFHAALKQLELKQQKESIMLARADYSNILIELHSSFWKKISAQGIYFSPEQLSAISSCEFTRKINFARSNIFSLGMTLLHVCTLEEPHGLFYSNWRVDYGRINEVMVVQLEKYYSRPLLVLIGRMLNENCGYRIGSQEIREGYGSFMRGEYQIEINVNKEAKKSMKRKVF